MVGGTLAKLSGGDFSTGAIATAVSHLISEFVKEKLLSDFDLANPPFDTNDPQALTAYADKIDAQIKAISSVVSGAAAIITTEDIRSC